MLMKYLLNSDDENTVKETKKKKKIGDYECRNHVKAVVDFIQRENVTTVDKISKSTKVDKKRVYEIIFVLEWLDLVFKKGRNVCWCIKTTEEYFLNIDAPILDETEKKNIDI